MTASRSVLLLRAENFSRYARAEAESRLDEEKREFAAALISGLLQLDGGLIWQHNLLHRLNVAQFLVAALFDLSQQLLLPFLALQLRLVRQNHFLLRVGMSELRRVEAFNAGHELIVLLLQLNVYMNQNQTAITMSALNCKAISQTIFSQRSACHSSAEHRR